MPHVDRIRFQYEPHPDSRRKTESRTECRGDRDLPSLGNRALVRQGLFIVGEKRRVHPVG